MNRPRSQLFEIKLECSEYMNTGSAFISPIYFLYVGKVKVAVKTQLQLGY